MAFAICFVFGLIVGLPALRLSGVYLALVTFALAVSVPQHPAEVLELPRRQRRRHVLGGQSATSGSTSPPGRARRSSSCSRGCFCAAASAVRSARSATARSRRWRPGSSCRSTRRSPSGSRPPTPESRDRSSCSSTNGFAQPGEFGVFLSLQLLIGAAVAGLGSLWGILAGAAFVGLLPQISSSVPVIGARARPGRRLRRGGDPRHAPATRRLRRPRGAAPAPGARLNRQSISIKLPGKSSLQTQSEFSTGHHSKIGGVVHAGQP